ncbi:hypothetical protein EAI_00948 [Harpegnathos saltator]|uniref:Uncharacterized protein n=1 Tax=Harpegnathos saltator TaxID=610380 RepID=E2BHP6_HARSA|nr:hypothetical protein EAI_00948 [Harpegnathos saltator]
MNDKWSLQRVFLCPNDSETKQPRRAARIGAKHVVFVLPSDQDEPEARWHESRRDHEEHAKGIKRSTPSTMTHAGSRQSGPT